jgi:hypothetical protein
MSTRGGTQQKLNSDEATLTFLRRGIAEDRRSHEEGILVQFILT